MKIYDCFCYLNEDMLLEIRLETLWSKVDIFVICEATYTQVGVPKQLNFSIEKFKKFSSKIRYLIVDHLPPGELSAWRNERYQRDYLIKGLYDADPGDLILVSDLDEIPRPCSISSFQSTRYRRGDFHQLAFVYRFNNLSVRKNGEPATWRGSKITTFANLQEFFGSLTNVRSFKSFGAFRALRRYFFKKFSVQNIPNGGWHFTWILPTEKIIFKLESIAEQEHNLPKNKIPENIERTIREGRCILNAKSRYVAQPINSEMLPDFLVNNYETYRMWMRDNQ